MLIDSDDNNLLKNEIKHLMEIKKQYEYNLELSIKQTEHYKEIVEAFKEFNNNLDDNEDWHGHQLSDEIEAILKKYGESK